MKEEEIVGNRREIWSRAYALARRNDFLPADDRPSTLVDGWIPVPWVRVGIHVVHHLSVDRRFQTHSAADGTSVAV